MNYIIAGVDIETTGLKQEDGHRIIEIGISVHTTKDGKTFRKLGDTWLQRVNPMRSIDKKAQAVHGIALEDLKGAPEWDTVAKKVHTILSTCNLMVAHNVDFDAVFIAMELARLGLSVPKMDVFCTMQNGRHATAFGNVPNLGALCWAYGVEYDATAAHAADYDIDVTMACFFKGLERGEFVVPSLNEFVEKRLVA